MRAGRALWTGLRPRAVMKGRPPRPDVAARSSPAPAPRSAPRVPLRRRAASPGHRRRRALVARGGGDVRDRRSAPAEEASSRSGRWSTRGRLVGLEVRRKRAAIVDGRLAEAGPRRARARLRGGREARLARGLFPGRRRRARLFPLPRSLVEKAPPEAHRAGRLSVVDRLPAACLHDGGELFVQTDVKYRADAVRGAPRRRPSRSSPRETPPAARASRRIRTTPAAPGSAARSPTACRSIGCGSGSGRRGGGRAARRRASYCGSLNR